jgi:antitoxin (DNA-binding transcriptional repressor) of toxin-antitoxin stability system
VITVNGKPSFQLVPLEQEDDLIDRLLADHPGFRHLLEARLREPTLSAAVLTSRNTARLRPSGTAVEGTSSASINSSDSIPALRRSSRFIPSTTRVSRRRWLKGRL